MSLKRWQETTRLQDVKLPAVVTDSPFSYTNPPLLHRHLALEPWGPLGRTLRRYSRVQAADGGSKAAR